MPTATNGDVSLHYDWDGEGRVSAAPIVFVNDVGVGAWSWGWQHAALCGPFATLVWDLRGTGRSDCPAGPYDVQTLAADLEAVLADAAVADVHLVGAGLGGMVALDYAHRYSRAVSLTLIGTAGSGDAVTDRLAGLRASPDASDATLRNSLASAFATDLADHPDVAADIVAWRRQDDASLAGWDAQAAAMRAFEAPPLYEVTPPAQVIHGTADAIVPVAAGESLAEDLPRGDFLPVEGAGHAVQIEDSGAVTDAITDMVEDAR